MAKITEEEVIQKYALSDEEIERIKETVISILSCNKSPEKGTPLAIVVGGQSGSGKTALMDYTLQLSPGKFIMIDNDFFRGLHPKASEIEKKYPEYYTAATDQIGLGITSDIIDHFVKNKYNLILHQTLRGNRVADDAITKLRQSGYIVGIRAFAVPYFESKMSQIERCLAQLKNLGFCRYVRKVDHDAAIKGLPETVDYIEKTGKYDFMEVFKRGHDISFPTIVYAKLNPETKRKTLEVLSKLRNCETATLEDEHFGFTSAKDAVLKTRDTESLRLEQDIDERIEEAKKSPFMTEEMKIHINELEDELARFREELGKRFS